MSTVDVKTPAKEAAPTGGRICYDTGRLCSTLPARTSETC